MSGEEFSSGPAPVVPSVHSEFSPADATADPERGLMKTKHLVFGLILFSCSCRSGPGPSAKALIIRSGSSTIQERLAAKELRRYIYLRTGTSSDIVEEASPADAGPDLVIGV